MQPNFDIHAVATPAYVVDEALLTRNLEILRQVREAAGCKILLAQKAFSMFHFYPLIAQYLDGATASGLYEARLGHEHFSKENHVFSPAYRAEDILLLTKICDHMVFNSLRQWQMYGAQALGAGVSCGLRVNPQHSTQQTPIYDPCAPGSRLGITRADMPDVLPPGVEGLHFHTLCEQNADALAETLGAVEEQFGAYLPGLRWLNLGGGHHITRENYDRELLIRLVKGVKERYGCEVYLEPGEAVALDAGFLVATVLDIVENSGVSIAIVDTSAACHMPDVLEMPYRPPLLNSGLPGELAFTYRLAAPTCLAGDIIGDFSFEEPLQIGQRLVFADMAIYSMVKNNTFNGMPLPSIYAAEQDDLKLVRAFGYEDFKGRLS